ncbi:MAG: hypothetical protein AAF790_06195 [Planctomycetota bacterium]
MSLIEAEYQRRIDAMTPAERVRRSAEMAAWARAAISRQILAEQGPRSPQRLRWQVAQRVYSTDEKAKAVIQRELDGVPA